MEGHSERLDRLPLSSREAPTPKKIPVRAARNLPRYWVQVHVKDKVVAVALQKCPKWTRVSVTMGDKNTTTL